MKKLHHLIMVASVAAAATAFGQESVTRTEKTVTRTDTANGSSQVTRTVSTTVTTYVDRLRTVYQEVGIPQPLIARLIDLDREIYQAYIAGNWTRVRELRIQQRQLLNRDQVVKVYNYFESNPLPAEIAPIATYTYIPQQQFQTYVVQNETGRIDPGTLSVPGVRATATFQTGEDGVEIRRDGATRPAIRTNGETREGVEIQGQINSDTDTDRTTIRTGTEANKPAVGTTEIRSGSEARPNAAPGTELKPDTNATIKTDKQEMNNGAANSSADRGYESSNAPHPAGTNPAGQQHAVPTSESTGAGQSQSSPSEQGQTQSQSPSKSEKN